MPINGQSLGRIVAGDKTQTFLFHLRNGLRAQLFIAHSEAGFK
jgi:hypothetical protein